MGAWTVDARTAMLLLRVKNVKNGETERIEISTSNFVAGTTNNRSQRARDGREEFRSVVMHVDSVLIQPLRPGLIKRSVFRLTKTKACSLGDLTRRGSHHGLLHAAGNQRAIFQERNALDSARSHSRDGVRSKCSSTLSGSHQ